MCLFKESLDDIPWKVVLRDQGVEQIWQCFKDRYESTIALHSPVYEIKQERKKTSMATLRSAVLNEGRERNAQTVDVEMGGLRRIQEYCPDMQKWDLESQGADGTESGEEYEKQEGIL